MHKNEYKQLKDFRIHKRMYMIIIPILFSINIFLVPQFLWFFFPMIGWGIGLTMHYIHGPRAIKKIKKELYHL